MILAVNQPAPQGALASPHLLSPTQLLGLLVTCFVAWRNIRVRCPVRPCQSLFVICCRTLAGLLAVICFVAFAGCSNEGESKLHQSNAQIDPNPIRLQGDIFGTHYSIVLAQVSQQIDTKLVHQAIKARLAEIDQSMSSWKDDSELNRFLASPVGEWLSVSNDLLTVLRVAQQIYQHTEGAFDPSLGPLIRLWGFQGEARTEPPSKQAVADALALIGFDQLQLSDTQARRMVPIEINLSAIAKGYAVDAIANLLRSQGIANFLVEIGGEVVTAGTRYGQAWKVAIEAPSPNRREIEKILHLRNASLATSGSYRNYFSSGGVSYQHIIDPATGYPGTSAYALDGDELNYRVVSVSVIAADCTTADGYATAFMLLGERALQLAPTLGLEALMLIEQQGVLVSKATAGFERYYVTGEPAATGNTAE